MSKDRDDTLKRARRLEWIGIAYLCSSVTLLLIVMAGSQALKTEFVGDALSMIAPVLFLIGGRISRKPASELYPFGFERAVTAGYLGAALALLATGSFLLVDSASKLALAEHPVIGGFSMFGHVVWTGWLAIGVLTYSSIPAFFLGRAKEKLAKELHDKVLLADAKTNAADWQSAGAAMLGMIGLAFGLWWADALAALVISLEICRSGLGELRSALGDIMDRRPQQLGDGQLDPLPEKLSAFLRGQDWVADAVVRVRERGREFAAEAFVQPRSDADLTAHIAEASERATGIDARLRQISISPVREFSPEMIAIRPDQPRN